jgi:branched-chain amino acid aminotransferase
VQTGYICYNGKFVPGSEPILTADNRSFRYGDGCFETMKVYQGQILMADLHFERLMTSMNRLHFDLPPHFTREYFIRLITELCTRNGVSRLARVRLTIFRSSGGFYEPTDNTANFIIQCGELSRRIFELNENGLSVDVFPDARKSSDKLSSIKSNNCLAYVMAAMFARQQMLDEAILLNHQGRVADTTNANIFIVRNQRIITPPLSEGGVCGVMRKYLLKADLPFRIEEYPLTIADLENADEIFLTNAIYGIRWIGLFRDSSYGNATSAILHETIFEQLLAPRS